MKNRIGLLVCVVLLVCGEIRVQAWQPTGWVYFPICHTDYAWQTGENSWYFADPSGGTEQCYSYHSGNWSRWGQNAVTDGWCYFRWPYAYSLTDGSWYYCNSNVVWAWGFGAQTWSLLGTPVPAVTNLVVTNTVTVYVYVTNTAVVTNTVNITNTVVITNTVNVTNPTVVLTNSSSFADSVVFNGNSQVIASHGSYLWHYTESFSFTFDTLAGYPVTLIRTNDCQNYLIDMYNSLSASNTVETSMNPVSPGP